MNDKGLFFLVVLLSEFQLVKWLGLRLRRKDHFFTEVCCHILLDLDVEV